jgi:colanic acid biosynthesis glycosyl transferase WcaI
MPPKIWVISELYYPEETSTGYLLTKIAENLANHFPVSVLCAQPTYSNRGVRAPVDEVRNGVAIHRCSATTFNKDVLFLRIINFVTISVSILFQTWFKLKAGDCVLVVTNPPLLPFLMALACRLRRAKFLLLIHDVYPDSLIAAGLFTSSSLPAQIVRWLNQRLYRAADRIVVLGRDMKKLVEKKLDPQHYSRIVLIPNWADLDEVSPMDRKQNALLNELGLQNRFVIQYAGNMGRTHGLECLVECARQFNTQPELHFLFIGSGGKLRWLKETVEQLGLKNITILPQRPRTDQNNFLNACDIAVISYVSGMSGISVPSRMYNIMAAGKPILAVAEVDSELALVLKEEKIGWVASPGNVEALLETIRLVQSDPEIINEFSRRARTTVEEKYSLNAIIQLYVKMFVELYESKT